MPATQRQSLVGECEEHAGADRPPLEVPCDHGHGSLRGAKAVREEGVGTPAANDGPGRRHTASPRRSSPPTIGPRTELGRYRVSAEERVLYGQRINGCVRLTDRPANSGGRAYLVESGLEVDGFAALQALVAHYIDQAVEFDQVPMSTSALRRDPREQRPHKGNEQLTFEEN